MLGDEFRGANFLSAELLMLVNVTAPGDDLRHHGRHLRLDELCQFGGGGLLGAQCSGREERECGKQSATHERLGAGAGAGGRKGRANVLHALHRRKSIGRPDATL